MCWGIYFLVFYQLLLCLTTIVLSKNGPALLKISDCFGPKNGMSCIAENSQNLNMKYRNSIPMVSAYKFFLKKKKKKLFTNLMFKLVLLTPTKIGSQ